MTISLSSTCSFVAFIL
jgi:hypothetical protein